METKMAAHTFRLYAEIILLLSFLISRTPLVSGNSYKDILGCEGFVKSVVPIDFSKVEIKLFTKQGTLKESSDCAPTNGYYFIPIYDKGEYLLKIQPPDDWYFEPKEISLNFDGVNDACSKSQDINFIFKGFTLEGKVNSANSNEGPKHVTVSLVSQTDKSFNLLTSTGEGGNYRFAPVLTGHYLITASHGNFRFSKDFIKVEVKSDNVRVPPDTLVIAGYDVRGRVLYNGEPTVGVNFVMLASEEKNRNVKGEDCSKTPLVGFKYKDYVCHVASRERGIFLFKTIPPGNYIIKPHFSKFDVHPREMKITVKHEHLNLPENFLVKGFIVSGRILSSLGGSGLKNADIYLNNEKVTTTDAEGKYTLDSMKPGNYVLSVQSENFKFKDVEIKLSPLVSEIPHIHPSEFKVCGLVTSASDQKPRTVVLSSANDDDNWKETTADRETGKFCQFLKPGHYNLAVKLTEAEKMAGMQYLPLIREVHVKNSPISDIEFTQLRGIVQGRVIKLPEFTKFTELSVKLKQSTIVKALKILKGDNLTYSFEEVMPGNYEVEVENNLWCFDEVVHPISLTTSKIIVPDFRQTGFKIQIKSSHETAAMVTDEAFNEYSPMKIFLRWGDNTLCLPHSGTHRLTPVGCHRFENDSYIIDPKLGITYDLKAVSHDVTGSIKSPQVVSDLIVEVIQLSGQTVRLNPIQEEKSVGDRSILYTFSYRAKENQILKFIPISEKLIFTPDSYEHRMQNDCAENVARFNAEKGLVIEGGIIPPLSNVKVTLKLNKNLNKDERDGDLTVLTKSDGKYKFGPLKSTVAFELIAEKESYVFSEIDKNGFFRAHKLAEIRVKVLDIVTKEPLAGVLLSLTGGENYRKNSITDENGSLSFHSLSPGEYFLRPMMKEYKFQPASQIIPIKEGVTETMELRGKRVSYSAYGLITSLNGEPEANVLIEAVGIHSCSDLIEEAFTEGNGKFRIRGLLPQCEYRIKLAKGVEANAPIHRLEPEELYVRTNMGDVRGIKLIAFYYINQMDLSVHVESTIPEHLKTLRLKLCKKKEPDSPVYIIKLDTLAGGVKNWGNAASQERFLNAGLLVQFPFIPRDNKSYFIQLESSLNKRTYSFQEPVIHFIADRTFKTFKMPFEPVLKTLDHELSQSNYILIFLLIIAALFSVYFHKALPFLQLIQDFLNQASQSFVRDERNFFAQSNGVENVEPEEAAVMPTKRKVKLRRT